MKQVENLMWYVRNTESVYEKSKELVNVAKQWNLAEMDDLLKSHPIMMTIISDAIKACNTVIDFPQDEIDEVISQHASYLMSCVVLNHNIKG